MVLKLKVILIVIFILFLFPKEVSADEILYVHYISFDEEGGEVWKAKEVPVEKGFDKNEKAEILFRTMFEGIDDVSFVPENTRVLTSKINRCHLVLNVSHEIMDYGGSYYESCLKKQILKTALNIPDVNKVTLLIDNASRYLPEGSYIKDETIWNDV